MSTTKLITLAGDRSVHELAKRLVKEKVVGHVDDPARFEAELLRINPHLHDVIRLPPGTPVVVPLLPSADAPASGAAGRTLRETTMERVKETANAARAIYAAAAASEAARTAETAKAASVDALGELATLEPEIAREVAKAHADAKERTVKIEAAEKLRDTRFGNWVKRIDLDRR
jgi:hypothetical protein